MGKEIFENKKGESKMNERFSRQNKISWFDQKKVSNTNCLVCGCGGIGAWTALQLTFLGVRKIVLVDMDKVEESNLNRQFFYERDIGKMKAEALGDKLKKINSKVIVEMYTRKVETLEKEDFENIQFVFDCLDNIKTREYLSEFCWKNKMPFIHSACSDVIGEIQLVVNGKTKPMKAYDIAMKQKEDKQSCKDFDPAVCTTNMVVASFQVDKFLDYLIRKDTEKPFISYIRGKGVRYSD